MKIGSKHLKDEVPQAFIDIMEKSVGSLVSGGMLEEYENLILCKYCGKILLADRPVDSDNITDDDSRCDGMHPENSCMKCHLEMSDAGDHLYYKVHDDFRNSWQPFTMLEFKEKGKE